jgi:uroporphyrinogen-III synthase
MLVLLTRAADEAARSAAKLEASGHSALPSPVLEMVPTGAQWPTGMINAVLATSSRAFELFSDMPDWPLPEARRLMPLYVVGERTREAAHERGFEGQAQIEPDAKELGAKVAASLPPAARLVYLAGRDRKPDLEQSLVDAGHMVEVVEVYAAQAADALTETAIAALESGEIGAVLHYSRRSAEIFVDLAQRAGLELRNHTHVAISRDAAVPLWDARCTEVHVADKPNEQAMIAAVNALAGLARRLFFQREPRP